MSRLEADMTVEEALDVSAMPQTLRRLVQLASSDAVRLEAVLDIPTGDANGRLCEGIESR